MDRRGGEILYSSFEWYGQTGWGGNEILQENSNHSNERRGCCTVLLAFPPTLVFRCPGEAMSETLGF
jgi:hypothetical protein